jgi:hypothetical protein
MSARIWLSYDLGVDGDYEGMYHLLDNLHAVECGDSCASIQVDTPAKKDVFEQIKRQIRAAMKIRPRDRIYVIGRDAAGKWVGRFVFGSRKSSPWVGYATTGEAASDEE